MYFSNSPFITNASTHDSHIGKSKYCVFAHAWKHAESAHSCYLREKFAMRLASLLSLLIFSLSLSFFLFNDELRHANKPMACYLTGEFTRMQNCMGYGRRELMERETRRKHRAARCEPSRASPENSTPRRKIDDREHLISR